MLLATPGSQSATRQFPDWWAGYPTPRTGTVLVNVDSRSGRVIKASIYKSTGDKRLDAYAIAAFKTARFKPGTVPFVRIPVTFTKFGMQVAR